MSIQSVVCSIVIGLCDPKNCALYVKGKAKHGGNNDYCFVKED